MFILKKILSALLLPPFGLLLLAVFGLLLATWRPALGRRLGLVALGALATLTVPAVGDALLRSLETDPPIGAQALAGADAIVVLGGGAYRAAPEFAGETTVNRYSLQRVRYAAVLQRRSGLPVLVTGGAPFGGRPEAAAMKDALQDDFGVPVRWAETASRDTAENAALSAPLLKAAGVKRIALVSHAWHLRRATELFAAQGFVVIPAPTGYTTGSPSLWEEWLPSAAALDRSAVACHEWVGRWMQPGR